MSLIPPIARGLHSLVKQNTHPGLELDRLAESWDDTGDRRGLSERVQRPAVDQVVRLSNSPPMPPPEYAALFQRWKATVGKHAFTGTTAGPLTLHLARASALENAGICFHRVYGFVYLPGSGLKGLARAFAETVWLDSEDDKLAAWQQIEAVFGWAPGSNKDKPHLPDRTEVYRKDRPASSGAVVFHDAWPERWPRLVTDILNSHHPKYYSEGKPPGDWEDPVPVYFLSVETGTPFRFAVAPRRGDTDPELVTLAREWLIGGLTQLGAGAKTASGYGDFTVPDPKVLPITSASRPSFTATLELVTPAFLAGANQQADDCDLRPSTLRGQLRWWWRTMHAGFVTVEELRKMEAAIWGDTKQGGAVRVTVRRNDPEPAIEYDRRRILREHQVPQPNDGSIPGLTYHSYGMDEAKGRRYYLEPGTRWTVTATARRSRHADHDLDPQSTLGQFTAALTLLTRFGGVGAKARKGFGSFVDVGEFDLDKIKECAAAIRTKCGLAERMFNEKLAASPNLHQMLPPVEVPTGGTGCWLALDRLAVTVQQFVKTVQPKHARRWLGTPRRLRGAVGPKLAHENRHASPAVYHFAKDATGRLVARAVAFPAAELPNTGDSHAILTDLLAAVGKNLAAEFAQPEIARRMNSSAARSAPPATVRAIQPQVPVKRTAGKPVQVTILQKRAKGGFDVQEVGQPAGTLTLGSPPAGVDTADGATVTVWVHYDDPAKPQYKWPDRPRSGKK